jgi:O-antigen/teichoic acid export membrane protein
VTRSRDAALYAGGLLFQQAAALATGTAVARWLGPQSYGEVSLARSVYAVAVIVAPLGLDLALLRRLGELGPGPGGAALLRVLRRLVMATTFALTAAAWLAGPWLQRAFYRQPDFALGLGVSFLALPFAADLALLNALARARERVGAAALCTLYLQPVARSLALLAFARLGLGAVGVLAATAVGVAAAERALAIAIHRETATRQAEGPATAVRPLLGYSAWMACTLLAYNGLKLMDVLVLGAVRAAGEVGIYAALAAIAQLVGLYPAALSQSLAPAVSGLYARGDRTGARRELSGYLRRASLAGAPLFASVAVFAPWLDLLFGRRFHFDGGLAFLLALSAYVGGVFGPMSVSLSMTGRHRQELAILAAGAALSFSGCLAWGPRWGGLGVAGATLGGSLFVNAMRTWRSVGVVGGLDVRAADLAPPLACLALAWAWRAMAERLGAHDLPTAAWTALGLAASLALLYRLVLLDGGERAAMDTLMRPRWRSTAAAAPSRS